jgi:hypothetical protein
MDPSKVDELMHRVDEGFAEDIQREPGFVAYEALDCGDGEVVTITTFRDRDGAEDSIAKAAAWVRDNLSDVEIERTDAFTGEAKVSRATADMLEPAHA